MAQSANPADIGVSIGQVFFGKYRVESILGQGGMGVVVACTHLGLDEKVAIKMLRPDVLRDPDAAERFMREAQAASKLKSEYVARIFDRGTLQNGVPYMIMEFLEGLDLDQMIRERGHLEIPWAVGLVLQTAEALAEAHSIGIVHRDIKPSNLFVTWRPDGTSLVKVLDFGISKSSMGSDMQLTQTQSVLGTPSYMSPEQMRSARNVDARTDVWSLGTVLYEILEGRRPFEADSFSEMCVKVAVDAPTPMLRTPPAMQQVVMRCLEKSPDLRYGSMAELGRDLIPFATDPHQASALVERMQRMLRRSQAEWDAPPSLVPRTPPPGVVQELAPGAFLDGSSPFVRPISLAIPPPKRSLRIPMIVGMLAIAGGVTAAIMVTTDDPPVPQSAPLVAPATAVAPPPSPVPSTPPPTQLAVPGPTMPAATSDSKAEPPAPGKAGDAVNTPPNSPADSNHEAAKPNRSGEAKRKPPKQPPPIPQSNHVTVPKRPAPAETVKKEPPKPKCPVVDPFDNRAGSGASAKDCAK